MDFRSNSLRPSPGPRRVGSRDPPHPPPWHRRIFSNPPQPDDRLPRSVLLSRYLLPTSTNRPERATPRARRAAPGLLGGLYPHPSPLAEIALQYNHRHNPRQQQRHLAVARDRASPVDCPRSGARSGGGAGASKSTARQSCSTNPRSSRRSVARIISLSPSLSGALPLYGANQLRSETPTCAGPRWESHSHNQ